MKVLLAFLLLLLYGCGIPVLPALPEITLAPRAGLGRPMPEIADVVADVSSWPVAHAATSSYGVPSQWFRFNDEATIARLIDGLKKNHLALDVGIGVLDPDASCGTWGEGFNVGDNAPMLAAIQKAGGTISSVTLDEPLYYGPLACPWNDDVLAGKMIAGLSPILAAFPNARVYDVEPAPIAGNWQQLYAGRIAAYTNAGGKLDGFRFDMQWTQQNAIPDVVAFAKILKVPIGLFVTGNGSTDKAWIDSAVANYRAYKAAGGPAASLFVATWEDHPSAIVPESGDTLTNVIVQIGK